MTHTTPIRFERRALEAVVRGDRAARERFFDHFYDRVVRYVAATVGDVMLAEDLAHEVFLKLDATLHRIDPERDPDRWVFTVAKNTIRDHWRRRETKQDRRAVEIDDARDVAIGTTPPVDESLVADEEHARVRRAMATLSEDDRTILALRTFGELDHEEIAATLDLQLATVRQRWSRAVRRLGTAYRDLERAEGGAA